MRRGLVLCVGLLFVLLVPSVSLSGANVFDAFSAGYATGVGDYAAVGISPCDGKAYGFVIYANVDGITISRFDETVEDSNVAVDVIGDECTDCWDGYSYAIEFEYINDECDIALAVKANLNDTTVHWVQRNYIASSPYDQEHFVHLSHLDKSWQRSSSFGPYYFKYEGVCACGSTAFYYVYLSDDLGEFCLYDADGTRCFPNDPPLQSGTCYAEGGDHFYIGVFYVYNSNETVHVRKFDLSESGSLPTSDYSLSLDDTTSYSGIVIVERGWEQQVFVVAGSGKSTGSVHLVLLGTDLAYIQSADIQNGLTIEEKLYYRPADGFLFMNYHYGKLLQQVSLVSLEMSDVYSTEHFYGHVAVDPNPASAKVCAAFGDGKLLFLRSALNLAHPTLSQELPDLYFYMNKPENFTFHSEYFGEVGTCPEFGCFHLREPSDDFSFVHFDVDSGTFSGTAPCSLLSKMPPGTLDISEVFYMRVYSKDDVFMDASFRVYVHAYIASKGVPIPLVSYENGKDVDTTINLLDYFYLSDPPDFDIRVSEVNGLPEGVSLDLDVPGRTIHLGGTVPVDVEKCRNPYPIEVTLSDCCSNYTTEFVFEATKDRPVIDTSVVSDTMHYYPSQSVPMNTGININVGDSFIEGAQTLKYAARLRDGSPLPSWLMFDPDTRMFSGITPSTGCHNLDIEIIALNDCGLDRSVYLTLSVVNEPPTFDESLSNITDQTLSAGEKGSFVFDARCFKNRESDVEGPLEFEYRTMVDGVTVANPVWLSMSYCDNDNTIRFDYDVPSTCLSYSLEIVGYDTCSLNPPAVSPQFLLTVTNEEPFLTSPVGDFVITGGEYFNVSLPPDTFRDPEGFSVAYQAVRINAESGDREPLPPYISFDSDTLSFSGVCNTGLNDTIHVLLEATDGCSIVSTEFDAIVVYVPPPPPSESSSTASEVFSVLGRSAAVSIAIGLGAFGFKTHLRERREKKTASLFQAQGANESVTRDLAEMGREKRIQLRVNDLRSIESRTLSDSERLTSENMEVSSGGSASGSIEMGGL